jgi:threonine aldolase
MASLRDVRRRFGGSVYQAWPSALLALDALDGFAERFGRAVAASERGFARLEAAGVDVERIPNGTNRRTIRLPPSRRVERQRALRRQGVELPAIDRDGRVTVTVNETWLRRPARDIADAVLAEITPKRCRPE